MFTMEFLLIVGLLLALAQFSVFIYLHRYQLGLVKPLPMYSTRPRSFLEQHGLGIYLGVCIALVLMRMFHRYIDWVD